MMNGKYRLNAGAIVFNREGKVLIFARADFDGQWQFPQGGIEAGEKPQAAALLRFSTADFRKIPKTRAQQYRTRTILVFVLFYRQRNGN